MSFDQKILCIGNETVDTDNICSKLSSDNGTINHGLISLPDFVPELPGYYHTTVVDLNEGQIFKISKHFNSIVWLDQPQDLYPHWRTFLRTFRLLKSLEEHGAKVSYPTNPDVVRIDYWWNLLRTNLSVCFQPFLAMVPDTNYTNICPKSKVPIKKVEDIKDWHSDSEYRKLRDPMLKGEKLDKHCDSCYKIESRDLESARQFETLEWAVRLKLNNIHDLDRYADPIFYEIRPSNKCNIMCRMCDDARSHLIEKERIQLNLPLLDFRFKDLSFDQIAFDTVQRIYVGGGEPTIMPEFYSFLQKCIDIGRTDFELCIGTNGMKFSNKLLNLLSKFSDVLLSFSFDGYGIVNDYIRWRSDFNTVHKNALLLQSLGHKIGLQTVPSMYNATRIHEIFEFYDQEFPGASSLVQAASGHDNILLPWNHPCPELVVSSMEKCMRTDQYHMNGRSAQSYIDTMYKLYSDPNYTCDLNLLRKFYEFNDLLDQARGSKLGDYIPELESGRKLL